MHFVCISEYIFQLDGGSDFIGLCECDSNTHAQSSEGMPFPPTVIVHDFTCFADPGMEEMVLGARDMPDCIADPVLTRTGACEPFLFCQIICIVMDDIIQIGELLFEIGS